jgi:hypothetical protein
MYEEELLDGKFFDKKTAKKDFRGILTYATFDFYSNQKREIFRRKCVLDEFSQEINYFRTRKYKFIQILLYFCKN